MSFCFLFLLKGSTSYSNCACAAKSGESAGQMKKGNCYIDCGLKFLLFMAAVVLTPLFTLMSNAPALVVTLRYASNLLKYHLDLHAISKDDTDCML